MLQAYMDDSGSHDGSHNCVIAGYWGGVREWARFEAEWKQVLQSEGIQEFKANEFWFRLPDGQRVGPYKLWSDDRHKNFIGRLLSVIENRRIVPFASGFVRVDWNNLPLIFRRILAGLDGDGSDNHQIKPVILPFTLCVGRAAHYCRPGKTMHFVMDSDPRVSTRAAGVYATLKREVIRDVGSLECTLGELTFADSRDVAPLQAADLLAYEAHRYAKKGNATLPVRDEYRRALAHIRSVEDFQLFDGPRFERLQQAIVANAKLIHQRKTK